MKGKELEEFIILTALDQVYSMHSGLKTYEALNEGNLLDEDEIWEPFEYYEADMMSELVENTISAFTRFAQDIQK